MEEQHSARGAFPDRAVALAGRFEIRGVVGSGTLGAVFRSRDRHLDQDVALKVLRPELFPSAQARNRLRAACLQAERISHPGLVRLYGSDVGTGSPFFASQFVDGLNLRRTMQRRQERQRPFMLAEVVRLVREIATALELVYVGYPAHGLLKPENVLILPGLIKLTDFHLAASLDLAGLAMVERRPGRGYLAPELQMGLPLSPALDVYSLAAMVVELLTGERAAPGARPRVTAVRPELPGALEMVLARSLDEDPFVRPATPGALAQALFEMLENDGAFRTSHTAARAGSAPARPTAPGPYSPARSGRAVGEVGRERS